MVYQKSDLNKGKIETFLPLIPFVIERLLENFLTKRSNMTVFHSGKSFCLIVLLSILSLYTYSQDTTWYTLASGNWDDPTIWTLDPSGALPKNPDNLTPSTAVTGNTHKVVILSGRTIDVYSNNKTNASLKVVGRIDFHASTGHTFTEIIGGGKIILRADNFPGGDASYFVTAGQGEGTVIFDSTGYDLNTAHTFYNVEIALDNSTDAVVLLSDYQINGNLTLTQGELQINDGSAGAAALRDLTVHGNVNVSANASITVGTGNAYDGTLNYYNRFHDFYVGGDFVSYGVIRLTNQVRPNYTVQTNNGAVTLHFTGAADNYFKLYNTTDLYNLHVDKGTDATYELSIYAHDKAFFALFGPNYSTFTMNVVHPQHNKAFWIEAGSVRLKGEIVIPSLGEGGNDWSIGGNAALILDGENVEVYSTGRTSPTFDWSGFSHAEPDNISNGTGSQGIYVYGDLIIENGYFSSQNSAGIVYRPEAAGSVNISGGEADIAQLRLTGAATTGFYSYIQSGGIFRVRGNGEESNSYALFSLNEPEMYFSMTGGQLLIEDFTSYPVGAIEILCNDGNYNVTGGEVICDWGGASEVYSTAGFFDFSVVSGTTADVAYTLTVNNDLTIDATSTLDANGFDVLIGGDFIFEDGATYTHGNNTTYFVGSGNSVINIENTGTPSDLVFYNLAIEKDKLTTTTFYEVSLLSAGRSETAGVAANTAVTVLNDLQITRGSYNSYRYTTALNADIEIIDGEITADGTNPGRIELTGGSIQHTLKGSAFKEQSFGHIELDDANGVILLTDINCTDVTLTNGMFDLDIYNLTATGILSGYSATKYFRTAGNASDRGLTISFSLTGNYGANTLVVTVPVGSPLGYSRAELFIDGYNFGATSYSGTVRVTPVNSMHPGAPAGALAYYWVSEQTGFDAVPNGEVIYRFYLPTGLTKDGPHRDHGLIGSEWYQTNTEGTNNIVRFNHANFGFVDGEFTSGNAGQFNNRRTLYSVGPQWVVGSPPMNWHAQSTWSLTSHDGPALSGGGPGGALPRATDICVVGRGHRINATAAGFTIGRLEFDHDTTLGANGFEDIPRVQINGNYTFNFGKVVGTGMFTQWRANANNPTVTGDFGEFANQKYSWYLFVAENDNVVMPTNQVIFPNLATETNVGGYRLIFPQDIFINYDLNPRGNSIILLNNGAAGDIYVSGNCYIGDWGDAKIQFPTNGTNRILSIEGDLDFTKSAAAYVPTNYREIEVVNTAPSSLEHQLFIGGNIIQGVGVIDLYNGSGTANNAVLTLNGEENKSFTKTGTPATDLYRLVVEKLQGYSFTFNDDFTLSGPTNGATKALELISGDLIILGGNTDITLTSGGNDFQIPSASSLTAENCTIRMSGSSSGIYLDGLLYAGDNSVWYLNEGTDNYIEYSASGSAEIQIDNAEFRLGSQIRRNIITEDGILTFSQNDNSSVVVIGETGADASGNRRGMFEILNTGSSFYQTAGANITIVQSQPTPAIASLYLDPASSSIGLGSSITFGNASTPAAQDMGIYSKIDLQNLVIDNSSGNNPTVTEWIVPLTINEDLTIQSGAELDANGLDLTINGNLYNSGTFTPSGNTTYLSGTGNQRIVGNTDFYNLTKTSTGELWLAENIAAITINNDLDIQDGIVRDSSNTITLLGDVNFDGTHIHGAQAGEGFYFNGSSEQELTGSGIFGKLTVNNPSGVTLPLGNNFTITDTLKLSNGVFGIGKNLLTLEVDAEIEEDNPFSATNMIQTNVSFTDYGVRKYLPSGAKNFVYPIGSGGKYTPVTLSITENTSNSGYLTVKAGDEMHPSIQEDVETPSIVDADNVLQYHWVMNSNNITGFRATAHMKYMPGDVKVTAPYTVLDYITARLLNDGSGLWNKYLDVDKFDETNEWCIFDFGLISPVDDEQISGDYTAGIDDAIPDQVPFYETNTNGNWPTDTIWTPNITGGPRGAMVRINSGHTVTTPSNFVSSYTTEIQGTVNIGSTFGHRFGNVTGSGLLYSEKEVIPAGVYDDFFSSAGGTLEFGGSSDYDVLGDHALINNLTFSGTGLRRLPSNNLTLNGDLRIDGGATMQVIVDDGYEIDIKGDLTRVDGIFDAGTDLTNTVIFTSTLNQTISGYFTGNSTLNTLEVDNPNGITVSSGTVNIAGELLLTDGVITTSATDTLRIGVTSTISPASGSASSHISGPLTKVMSSGDVFTFPVGKSGGLGLIEINDITGLTGVDTDVSVEYFFSNPNTVGNVASVGTGVSTVSQSEYWSIDVVGNGQSKVKITLDGSSDVANALTDLNDLIIVGWSGTQWEQIGGTYTILGTATSGSIACISNIDYSASGYQYITLASSVAITIITGSITSGDVEICEGESTDIILSFTGNGVTTWNFQLNGTPYSTNSSPYTVTVSPAVTTTYTLSDIDGDGTSGNEVGNIDVTVTVNEIPIPTLSASTGATICAGDLVIFTAGTGSNYDFYLNGGLAQSGTANTYNTTTLLNSDEVDVIVTSSNGCSSALGVVPVTMTVSAVPVPSISGSATSCEGSIDTYTTLLNSGNTYTWSVTSGTLQAANGVDVNSMDIQWGLLLPVGTLQKTETISVEEDNGTCAGTDTYNVVVYRVPQTGPQHHISNDWGQ
ncbi:MAG: hypothetical protein JXA77_01045 [Bacteroidales bacterium]|nr:hypothetical protein [Bacteroidales bacterium]